MSSAAVRWSWLLVLVVGAALFAVLHAVLVDTGNPNLVPAVIAIGAAVVPATFCVYVATHNRRERLAPLLIVLAAVVGGAVGVAVAGLLEYDTQRELGVVPLVGIGLIEESAKLIAPLALLLMVRPRTAANGLVLGVAAGAGFAVFETMGYALVELIESRGDVQALTDILLVRGLLSPGAHAAWTGLTAAMLWRVAESHGRLRAVAGFAGAFVVAVGLHATWDGVDGRVGYVVLTVVSLALLALVDHLAQRPPAGRAQQASRSSRAAPAGR